MLDDDNNPIFNSGSEVHGTYCAGIIAGDGTGGRFTGVAPDAKLMFIRADDEIGGGDDVSMMAAIQWIYDMKERWQSAFQMPKVISMSMSSKFSHQPPYAEWRKLLKINYDLGITHCNSIGNQGLKPYSGGCNGEQAYDYPIPYNIATPGNVPSAWLHYDQVPPLDCFYTYDTHINSVIGVGCVGKMDDWGSSSLGPAAWEDINGELYQPQSGEIIYECQQDQFLYGDYRYNRQYIWNISACYGEDPDGYYLNPLIKPDVMAPHGVTTLTLYSQYTGLDAFTGSSAATPHVAGTVGLMLSANPNLTMEQISKIIQTTAKELGEPGKDNKYGAGRIDAYKAVLLALAYANKSTVSNATWHNGARHVIWNDLLTHEVFTSGGEIIYLRKLDQIIETASVLSTGNGNNCLPCIWMSNSGTLHVCWQSKPGYYEIWYSQSTDNGNHWSEPKIPNDECRQIRVTSDQCATYPVIAEWNSGEEEQIILVFCGSTGLKYTVSYNNGVDWLDDTLGIHSSAGKPDNLVWYPSLASGGNYLTLTYDYRVSNPTLYSRIYNGTNWSNEVCVNNGTGTIYDRHSSVGIHYFGCPIAAWCAQKTDDYSFRILFRMGYPNNTWSSWFVEFARTPKKSDLYPSIAGYSGEDLWLIDILYHSTNNLIKLQQYNGSTWSTYLYSNTGQWANLSFYNTLPFWSLKMWTNQSASPYEVKAVWSPPPPKLDASTLVHNRRAVFQNKKDLSTLSLEVGTPRVITVEGDIIELPLKYRDIFDTLEVNYDRVFDYLGTDIIEIPPNAKSLIYEKRISIDILEDSTGFKGSTAFSIPPFSLDLLNGIDRILIFSIANNLDSGLVSLDVSSYRGRSVILKPTLAIPLHHLSNLIVGIGDVYYEKSEKDEKLLQNIQKILPTQNKLFEIFPNPFNPQTTIKFELVQAGHVNIGIYNQIGQEITKIVDQEQEAGFYERLWDASNMPSGIYYVQMIVRDQSGKHLYQETKKLLLMK